MTRNIFDTHTHYTSKSFNKNREELLQSLPSKGVALVLDCGTDHATSLQSIALAERYDYIYAAAGIHPQSLIEERSSTTLKFKGNWRAEMDAIAPLYSHPKVVAVGEVGLDHHWPVPKDAQLELFEHSIRTSLELDMPLVIHDREAHAETYALLKKYKPKGVLHTYSGSADDVAWLCRQGLYISFPGVVTFKNAQRPLAAAAAVPSEYLLLETDCPYMAPEPLRGKQSNSAMIIHIAEKIAAVRGTTTQDLLQLTLENGKRLFGIT